MRMHTPNLDQLAAEGVRFTNNFCNSPVCVSSRVCVLTGLYPEDTGVYNNEGAWQHFRMPFRPDTFPQVFARNGYRTADFGKVHVAREMYPGVDPEHEIFQLQNNEGGGMGIWQHLGEEAVQMIRAPGGGMNGGIFPDNESYPPEAVTNNALDWIGSADEPFLVRLSYLQPHTPVLPPARFVRLYADQDPGVPGPLPETMSRFEKRVAETHGLHRMNPERMRATRLHYYAQVGWVDEQVGRVIDCLRAKDIADNTIVVFSADHGNPIGDTGAYEKHTFTPTVHRVPLLFSCPDTLAPDTRTDVCDSLDLARTLFGLTGIESPAQFKGRDLFRDPEPDGIFSTLGFGEPDSKMGPNGGRGEWYGNRGWPRRSCVRTPQWRLDKNMRLDGCRPTPEDEDIFLADTHNDPAEMINLAGEPKYADVVERLCAMLDQHAEGAVHIDPQYLRRK